MVLSENARGKKNNKDKSSNQSSSTNQNDITKPNSTTKSSKRGRADLENGNSCSDSEESDLSQDEINHDEFEPLTFDVIELDEASRILGIKGSISDIDLITLLGKLSLDKNGILKNHSSRVAGAMLTVILNRSNWKVFRLFFDRLVGLELSVYLRNLRLPDGVTPTQLELQIHEPQMFITKVDSTELAYEILGLQPDATPAQIMDSITTLPESNDYGKFSFNLAAALRMASSPQHSKVLGAMAIASIIGEFSKTAKAMEFCEDVSLSIDEASDCLFGKIEKLATRLGKNEVALSAAHVTISEIRKKLAATSTSKTPITKVQLEQSRKREELLQKENLKLKERVSYCEDRMKELGKEVDREKAEKLDLSREVEILKEENFLLSTNSTSEGTTRSSETDRTSTKSDISIDSIPGSSNSQFVIERLLAQLKEANDKLLEKTNENTDLLLAFSSTA